MRRMSFGTVCAAALLAIAALAAMPSGARAQNAVFRGSVRSDGGEAIAGANVYIVELNTQVATNDAGRYVLTIPGERVRGQTYQLRVRAIGYRPSSRAVTLAAGEQTADFTLAVDINRLEEIVVTGVLEGTEQTKMAFAVARVDMDDVPVPPVDPLRALVGRVPGAIVNSNNGRPGAAPEVILRGPRSINAQGRSQGPLYVVDGIIINGALPNINPADIENIEVVKGASGASLYGARGGNGVINITTRSGRRSADGMSFNVRAEYGQSDIERDFGIARNHYLIMDARNERFCRNVSGMCTYSINWLAEAARVNNVAGDIADSPVSFMLDLGASGTPTVLRNNYQAKQWPGRVYNAVDQSVTLNDVLSTNLDATGRFGQTMFFASVSFLDQAGALRFVEGYNRYTARLNVDQRIGTQWSLAFRTYFSQSEEDFNAPSFFRLTRQPAIVDDLARDTLGRLYIRTNMLASGQQNENPLYSAENLSNTGDTRRFLGGATLRYQPTDWATLEGNFSYDYSSSSGDAYQPKGYRATTASSIANASFLGQAYLGYVYSGESNAQSMNTDLNLTIRRNLAREIATTFTLRYQYDQQDFDSRSGSGYTLNAVGVTTLNNASIINSPASSYSSIRGISYTAGVGAEIKERYILDATIRYEGSSLFGEDNRWATFGRVSGAWRLSQESWWFFPEALNEFKLRASYGTAGGRPNFSAQYETFTVGTGGLSFGDLGNKDLKPEVTYDRELGVDLEFLRRFALNATWARAETRDQILRVRAPADVGFSNQWDNAGTMLNESFELSLSVPVIQSRDVSWVWRFGYDTYKTTITQLNVPPQRFGATAQNSDQMFLLQEGEEYGTFYGVGYVRSCDQLPDRTAYGGVNFQELCGGPGSQFQVNQDGYVVWTGGYGVDEGITRNLWGTELASGANAPWGRQTFWGMPLTIRDTTCIATPSASCPILQVPLGNALPDFQFSVSQNFQYRRLSVYALLQAAVGRDIWNQGRHWAHLELLAAESDQGGRSVQNAKPLGYYWRGGAPEGSGTNGFYQTLVPTSHFVEEASYAKLRELAVTYALGPVGGMGNWTVAMIGRNLFTFTDYKGFDPEVGQGGAGLSNSGLVNAVDAFFFPNTRSFTFSVSTSF